MKCPNCLSTMYNSTEIVEVNSNAQLMDLHCHNKSCPSTIINYTPHVGVLVHYNNPWWVCRNYSLPMQHSSGKWYILKGTNQYIKNGDRGLTRLMTFKVTDLSTWVPGAGGGTYHTKGMITNQNIFEMEFVPLSTGDDMHLEATKLFNRLMGLVIFS